MSKTTYRGLDYGLGQTNVDPATGIRYGVVHMGAFISDDMEAQYWQGCGHCGTEIADEEIPDNDRFRCPTCGEMLDRDDLWGEEPVGWIYDDGELRIEGCADGDCFVVKSPVMIRAQYCSPCAPGAGHLGNPCDDGPWTYALPLEWFDDYQPAEYTADDLHPVPKDES